MELTVLAVDPNWLLSTIAQSAAAIVGLIGGLLITRLVGLATERQALVAQLAALDAEMEPLAGERARLEALDLDDLYDTFLDLGALDALVRDPDISFEVAVDAADLELGARLDLVRSRFQATSAAVREAHARLTDLGLEWDDDLESVQDRLRESIPRQMEGIYARLIEFLKPDPPRRAGLIPALDFASLRMPPMTAIPSAQEANAARDRNNRLDELRVELDALRAKRQVLEESLGSVRPVKAVWAAFAVVAYLAVAGVVLPVSLLPRENLSRTARTVVISLFAVGVASVIAYLFFLLRSLRAPQSSASHEKA